MKKRVPLRQLFLFAAPFPPLAFFKIWAATGHPRESLLAAALSMLVYCIAVIFLARRWDRPTYFDWTVGAYFGIVTVSLVLFPGSAAAFFERFAVTGIYACLFGAAFFPPLFRKAAFTEHYARKSAPEAVWGNPIFLRINRIMSFAWAAVFGVSMLLSLYPSVLTRALLPLALILGFGIPFNLRFPDRYLKKLGLPSLAEQKKAAS
ncbi:MAG: hypothetical protein HZB63_09680 [Deltaproteobacteria bacterium]|nr:hypothetical protein [Deltaproteobacteria bacterium]